MSEQYVTFTIKMPFYASLKHWLYILVNLFVDFAHKFGSSNPQNNWHLGTLDKQNKNIWLEYVYTHTYNLDSDKLYETNSINMSLEKL